MQPVARCTFAERDLLRIEAAEHAVHFSIYSGGEIELVDRASIAAVAELDAPESVDDYCLTMRVSNLVDELAGQRVISIDVAISEISNPQSSSECAEARGRQGDAPRRVKLAMLGEALRHAAVEVECIYDAVAFPGHVVVLASILYGIGDEHPGCAVHRDGHDIERGVTTRQLRINECIDRSHRVKQGVEHVHSTGAEIGGVQTSGAAGVGGDGESLIYGAGRIVDRDNR